MHHVLRRAAALLWGERRRAACRCLARWADVTAALRDAEEDRRVALRRMRRVGARLSRAQLGRAFRGWALDARAARWRAACGADARTRALLLEMLAMVP